MRLGVIADVHANLPALEAVLEDMPSVDALICLGDLVGYNPYPSECVERIREECDWVLQGNHDREIRNPEKYRRNPGAYRGLKLAKKELNEPDIEYLSSLPENMEIGDTQLYAVHSHPTVTDRYVLPGDFKNMKQYLDGYRGLFLGHTHLQHMERFDQGLILNPGSVGQPRDDDTRAAYSVVDTETLKTDMRRVSYDLWRVVKKINEAGLPEKTAQRLLPESIDGSKNRGTWNKRR